MTNRFKGANYFLQLVFVRRISKESDIDDITEFDTIKIKNDITEVLECFEIKMITDVILF